LFQLQLQSYPLTLYHLDGAALAQCAALIADRDSAATAIERMAARLLATVSQPKAVECVKGRFFDRASGKLSQLATFSWPGNAEGGRDLADGGAVDLVAPHHLV